ncbi:5-oxoprolinase/urea amidolyase family protein [Kocuria sediminis]|uniref:5-oxoprolinase/urea amidolyase family protein n=1 Tax=Kocuria sediminis TaxID=1038857 RepID=A0A6N8GM73_9MICC|nr:biotin-dependent carboxyltransferase family protein [Kocuria sediminis]MUN63367.1 5-oxoprolinase/urea amidolyase family protein [Kocuria sediminis]
MALRIEQPGLLTTVQDQGRFGYYNVGIPQGGAMDQESAQAANKLVGNSAEEAVLECTYMGPSFTVDAPTTIAVAGADVPLLVNGQERPPWTRIELAEGDAVKFGVIRGGARFYLAVRGGIDVPEVLGSRSTYAIGRLGGLHGRKLEAGDVVPVGEPTGLLPSIEEIPPSHRPAFGGPLELRIVWGLYDHLLTDEGRRRLVEEEWKLTPVADRMGLRFEGPGVEWIEREQPFGAGSDPSNIVDAGYAVGSIQVPGGTQPIVLHRDAVSGGGYAMVGTVISADMDLLARATPGTVTRFRAVDLEEAHAARRERAQRLEELWAL